MAESDISNATTKPGIETHRTNKLTQNLHNETSAINQFTGFALESLLQDPTIASQSPYQVLQSRLLFDETARFWWDTTAASLSKLMTRTGYPLPLHYKNLAFYYDIVLSGYGPIPSNSDSREWKATIVPDGSPFEPSWNLRTTGSSKESVIRFTIEPSSAESASARDPLNQNTTEELIIRSAAADPTIDLTVYEYLKAALFFDRDEAASLRREYPEHLAPQSYVAFDFEKDGRILCKLCFFFFWKAKQTGLSPRKVAFDLIASIPLIGPSITDALAAWERCLITFPTKFGGEPRVECMGFDLLQPSKSSRIKVYTRLWNSSFNAVAHFYSLGGMLEDSTTLKGLELLKLFWHVVCGIEDNEDFGDKEVPILHEGWADIVVNWEFKPDEALPRPKLYLPLWKWLATDHDICERLSMFWRRIGWSQLAESYAQDWQETFPWLESSEYGGMNYVSFAYKDDGSGLYMSLYFSPKVHTAAEKFGYT